MAKVEESFIKVEVAIQTTHDQSPILSDQNASRLNQSAFDWIKMPSDPIKMPRDRNKGNLIVDFSTLIAK